MELGEYRITLDSEHECQPWDVKHAERGYAGSVWPQEGGRFEATISRNGDVVKIATVWTLKAAVEQVIWYDRAINQEAA